MNNFGVLFKKYRLRAEFDSLTDFANAFTEKGYFYELSTFCRWQKGKRIPTKRDILFALTALLVERGAIATKHEANEFLESAGHGYFTSKELDKIFSTNLDTNSAVVAI